MKVREIGPGEQITEDGVYIVPIDRYHNDPDLFPGHSVSSTGLRLMARTNAPILYWRESVHNPERKRVKPTEAMRFGKGVHAMLLEGHLPEDEFAIHDFPEFSTNEGHKGEFQKDGRIWPSYVQYKRDWKAEQEAAEKTILSREKDFPIFARMAEVLAEEPMVKNGILQGPVEHTVVFKDPETGIYVKNRPDVIPTDDILGDYKAVESASQADISASLAKYGYHQQLALGVESIARVLDRQLQTAFLLAQEKTEPHLVNVTPLKDNAIWWGMRQNRKALHQIKWCLDNDRWPGFSRWDKSNGFVEGPHDIDLPNYYERRLLEEEELEGMPHVQLSQFMETK